MDIDMDKLSNAQLDRLADRLAYRADQRKGEREAAERERNNPRPLRPHIGNANILFANGLGRRNWDQLCIAALACQPFPFAVAPMTTVKTRSGKFLTAGQELRPFEHLNGLEGAPLVQVRRLIEQGYVLARHDAPTTEVQL